MWFDVGNERYTTIHPRTNTHIQLWFDVGNERYTTYFLKDDAVSKLWFDVGNERYTTEKCYNYIEFGCGLM